MPRRIIIISVLTLIIPLLTPMNSANSISAQVGEHRNDLAIGGNMGMMFTRMDFMPTIKQKYKQSPSVGFVARYICEKYFTTICGVQLEANLTNMGWEEMIEDGSGNTYKRDLTYLQIPLLMQMGWGYEHRGCKFLFEAGPQIGVNLNSKETYGGGTWDTSNRPNNIVGQYGLDVKNRFDYGITAGLGIELSTPIGHFMLGGRYYYGLGDVFDNSKKGIFGRSANQAISARVVYLIDIVRTKNNGKQAE